uniref:Secreted protein n=1 Tax=Alexandrium catenella TaxID=2925 RepID=A0A7S1LI73_ALECA|mmetsp:Transcript_114267/g.303732  ORF Transcript_114267/g.303732 Transcript_114267/m.303732 type:complete len:102 (+) Transcript_114267:98-403(+)
MSLVKVLLAVCLMQAVAPAAASPPGTYERLDDDTDLAAAMFGEEEASVGACPTPGCGADKTMGGKGEGISALQMDAQYKLEQPVKKAKAVRAKAVKKTVAK